MLSKVDCPGCGEFMKHGHVCDDEFDQIPLTLGGLTKVVFEALHPEEVEDEKQETIYDRHPLPIEGSQFFGGSEIDGRKG